MSTNYSRTYLVSAATTTAVTVVPSSRAFATAARHNSSGMRSERGIVLATSATDRVDDLNALVTATPATIGEPDDGIATGQARGGLNDALQALALPRRVDGPPTDDRLDCAPSVARLSLNVEGCSAHDLGSFRPFAVSTVCTLTVDTSTPSLERPA